MRSFGPHLLLAAAISAAAVPVRGDVRQTTMGIDRPRPEGGYAAQTAERHASFPLIYRSARQTRSATMSDANRDSAAATTHVADGSLPLSPRSRRTSGTQLAPASGIRAVVTVGSSLAVVLGIFLVVVWMGRRAHPNGALLLPKQVVEVLGRAPLAPRQQMHLVRIGNKLLLLSVNANSATTLSEITDADEVARLTEFCLQERSDHIRATFRQVLSQFISEPAEHGLSAARRSAVSESVGRGTTAAGRTREELDV